MRAWPASIIHLADGNVDRRKVAERPGWGLFAAAIGIRAARVACGIAAYALIVAAASSATIGNGITAPAGTIAAAALIACAA